VVTAQPSPEFRAHHDVAPPRIDHRAFRQGWQVWTRLDQLHVEGAIDAAAYDAAIAVRLDWELAYGRGRSSGIMALPGSGGGWSVEHDRQLRRTEAVGRLRRIAERLGAFDARLIDQCVVHDLSWPEIARRHGVHHQTARAYTIKALRRLAPEGATRRRAVSPVVGGGQEPNAA
jgi:DNA-directed RNA polymerase specialized sigma24 family protein